MKILDKSIKYRVEKYYGFASNNARAESPTAHSPQGKQATPWVTNCHSIDALKGQKHSMLNNLFKAFALTGRVFKIYNIFSHGFEGVLTL